MPKYDFSYARPYAGANNAFSRISGAMHDVFKTACDYRGDFSKVTDQRVGTAFFFNGKEVIQAMCSAVSSPDSAARVYSRFDEHYNVDCYGQGVESLLENMPTQERIALDFMLKCAIDSEVEGKNIQSDPARIEQFKAYMALLCDHYDLMDPRLSTAEGLFNADKTDVPDAEQCNDVVARLGIGASTSMRQHISDENLVRLCAVKSTLNTTQRYIDQYTECIDSYMNLLQQRHRVAKTFLYSHVTSNMGEFGTQKFRDHLYDSICGLSSHNYVREIKTVILGQVKEQLGLSFFSIGKARNADQIYNDLKVDVNRIAADFFDLNRGYTAQRRVLDLCAGQEKITNAVNDTLCALDDVFVQDAKKRFIFNPAIEKQRLLRVQDLYIRNDLCADELQLLSSISEDIDIAKWEKDRSPKERITSDLRIVNTFRDYAATYNGSESVSPISVSPEAKNLARQFGMAIRPSEKNATQLILRERAAHLEQFIIR